MPEAINTSIIALALMARQSPKTDPPNPPCRVVLDECVGVTSPLWRAVVRWLGPRPIEVVRLASAHPGIPDGAILGKLLTPGDILVTSDRVLHNRACADGHCSFTLTPAGDLTRKPLPGVSQSPRIAPGPSGELRETYDHVPHRLTVLLRQGMTARELKGYRTRRRRIRSVYGGQGNITQIALTVGQRPTARGAVCGFHLRVMGSGAKGLDATEGYCTDVLGTPRPALCAIRALAEVYLLDLEEVWTEVYFVPEASLELCHRLRGSGPSEDDIFEQGLHVLLGGIARLSLHPCRKGPFYEAMTRKLAQLESGGTNEVRQLDFAELTGRLTGRA